LAGTSQVISDCVIALGEKCHLVVPLTAVHQPAVQEWVKLQPKPIRPSQGGPKEKQPPVLPGADDHGRYACKADTFDLSIMCL
jgi:hypothetical protein